MTRGGGDGGTSLGVFGGQTDCLLVGRAGTAPA